MIPNFVFLLGNLFIPTLEDHLALLRRFLTAFLVLAILVIFVHYLLKTAVI